MNSKIYSNKISDIKFTNRDKHNIAYRRKKEEAKYSSLIVDIQYKVYSERGY